MSDVRCPMCSTPNPEDAEVCASCGARLKPLVADQPSPQGPSDWEEKPEPIEGEEPEEEDWLRRVRAEAESELPEEEVPEEAPEDAEAPDWLGRLREAEIPGEEGPPEGEVPDWLSAFAEEAGVEGEPTEAPEPDWLERIREQEALGPEEEVGEAEQEEEDWLARLTEEEEEPPEQVFKEVPSLEPDIDWMADEAEAEVEKLIEPEPEFEEPELAPIPSEVSEFKPTEVPEVALPEFEMPHEVEEPEIPPAPEPSDLEPAEIPEFELPEVELPREIEEVVEPRPSEIEEVIEPIEEEAPQVPALIFEEGEKGPPDDAPDLDLDAIELPDWLADLKQTAPPEKGPVEEGPPDLAPATLPSWLEAMRPIDTFRSVVEIEAEEEQIVESAGPLAGLRGALMAEPVVAMPRAASVSAARLEVTERQYAQAELLHRMVEEEDRELPEARAERGRLPFLRWVIGVLLILAVALPTVMSLQSGEGFPLPILRPRDLDPLFDLVERASVDQPVLVIFDYTPGYYGELDAVASPLLEHILTRGLRVATLSTQPTGPALADEMLSRLGENGQEYIHLGYLSGGPTAVQLFVASPREAAPKGFNLPEELERQTSWESPILEGVSRLSDFSMVVVITAGPENARTWVEQASPWKGETPLVMVLSTGAEPLVRPYYEALEPQVDAILTSLPAAVAYEQFIRSRAGAHTRWNAFGAGMLSVELILIAGAIYGVVGWLLNARRGKDGRRIG
ncbi:MAG TPA: zinc ribbon domain-containing protein [Anaerolineae bacterium]|nr:zinc ribbon domain-containing protein [Anaerolineae bacterium]